MEKAEIIEIINKFYKTDSRSLSYKEIEEFLKQYIVDKGHEDKKVYIPLLMLKHPDIGVLVGIACEYFISKYNIVRITKTTPVVGVQSVILFY